MNNGVSEYKFKDTHERQRSKTDSVSDDCFTLIAANDGEQKLENLLLTLRFRLLFDHFYTTARSELANCIIVPRSGEWHWKAFQKINLFSLLSKSNKTAQQAALSGKWPM